MTRPAPRALRALALALAALALAACASSDAATPAPTEERVPVRTAPITVVSTAEPVIVTGTLAAREEAPLAFAVGGVVSRVLVREGETVRRGQPLAELDLRAVDAQLDRARSGMAKAERDLARVRRLYDDSVATRQQLDDATTALEVARADLDAAAYGRRYATITATGSGAVLRRLVEPGQVVGAGTPVLVVGNRSAGTVLRVGLADRDVLRVRAGDRATVRFEAQPDRTYEGAVLAVGAAASAGTGTYPVEIRLADAHALPSGLVGRASIAPGSGDATARLVPTAAIVEADGERATVYTLVPDGAAAGDTLARARRVAVRLGAVRDDGVTVLTGLERATRVVTDGASFLSDDAAVRIVP